ncbi:hypothetical protein [Paracoccus litorisediminis]|uniref:Uncharacterized protein n=1 Tax=Paracoccus litorisediminis TaxID=2006130 RepID=A0A844HUP3_9RHOB|nr:hypothetical protein [Paracoccus litorisediminis]MTH62184.1 hypothetical protein [Paracoccus litorisediminis]
MPQFLASYDLTNTFPSPYAPFIEQTIPRGWSPWIPVQNGQAYRLPNTTVQGDFPTLEAAVAELEAARAATARAIGKIVEMPKWIVTEASNAIVASDEQR